MSKQAKLEALLHKVREAVPDIRGALIASPDGLVIASDVENESIAVRLAAMAASAQGLSQRIAKTAGLGEAREISVLGDEGQFVVYPMRNNHLLAIAAKKGANFGLIRLEVDEVAGDIGDTLEGKE